jgi:ribosomal protein S18 acetylase RimI-like enzyme
MRIRDFREVDADRVNEVALSAFAQFSLLYDDWPAMAAGISNMAALAQRGELIVAEHDGTIVGAVAYIPPDAIKAAYFDPGWPIIRMLVVDPDARGLGAGRALTDACIERARRDGSPVVALHTSPIMTVALPLYLRMGFRKLRDAPPIHGVDYAVYLKQLA